MLCLYLYSLCIVLCVIYCVTNKKKKKKNVCGAIGLGYIVTVAPKVGNRFPTKVSSKTNEKEALFASGNL